MKKLRCYLLAVLGAAGAAVAEPIAISAQPDTISFSQGDTSCGTEGRVCLTYLPPHPGEYAVVVVSMEECRFAYYGTGAIEGYGIRITSQEYTLAYEPYRGPYVQMHFFEAQSESVAVQMAVDQNRTGYTASQFVVYICEPYTLTVGIPDGDGTPRDTSFQIPTFTKFRLPPLLQPAGKRFSFWERIEGDL